MKWLSSGLSRRASALKKEAASISETSVNFYQITWRKNLEDSHFHTHRSEYMKSQFHNM
jgi:hypothetical protein